MTMLRSRFALIAAALAGTLAFAGCSSGDAGSDQPEAGKCPDGLQQVKVASIGLYSDTVLTLGTKQGIFADHCIEVSMQTVPSTPASLAAVSGGSVDIGYTTFVPFIRAVSEGLPIMLVAPDFGYTPDADKFKPMEVTPVGVFVAGDSAMTGAKDLEGKTVSIPALGAQGQVQVAADIMADGGDPSKVQWVALDFGTALAQLNDRNIDAATLAYPITMEAETAGNKLLFGSGLSLFPPGTANSGWVTSASTAKEKPELIAAFNEAFSEAKAYVMSNREELLKEVADYTKVSLESVKAQNLQYYAVDSATVEQLTAIAEVMKKVGELEKVPDLSGAIFSPK